MNGILVIDKPQDWTSHDVVGKLRGICKERRIGHSGTLDPLATGVLVVFIGRATRAVEFAENDEKEYLAGLRFGIRTDTADITGTILEQTDQRPERARVSEAISSFCGEIEQIPPMYSAIKLNGQKLYQLARKGQVVERKPRKVTIFRIDIVEENNEDLLLDVVCSKGTYIRTLCEDIGQKSSCPACMSSLRRIRAGRFTIEDSHSLEEVAEDPEKYLLPVDSLFYDLPAIKASENQEKVIRNGGAYSLDVPEGNYRVYSSNEEFLMLGEVAEGQMKTIKSFFEIQ